MLTIDARIMYAAYADECSRLRQQVMSYKDFCKIIKKDGMSNVIYPNFDAEDYYS